MSRGRLRSSADICCDCNASDPTWASINRGVLICDECCSVHRSLGRHISQVKSLKKGSWHPTVLSLVNQLVSISANSIWEHALLEPSQNKPVRRKPNPRDQTHPTKADFIRAKYQFLAFARKQKDGEFSSFDDLNKQLHTCVRTGNLETCLKLLSLGADPNYMHPEKGNCPLHMAAQAGHISIVELLIVYGADPGVPDVLGQTPVNYSRAEGHIDLTDRLIECQYELTDRLAYYLCGRKPDHKNGQHFIIPHMADSSLDLSELAKAAKKKLQALPNHLFEELAMDVYDEVDRRENDAIWLSTQNHSTLVMDRQSIPFLPVNPELSSTRNQGRQKLARFNAREFATLVIDILSEARRRQFGISSPIQSPRSDRHDSVNGELQDEPLYDSVPVDTHPQNGRQSGYHNAVDDEPLYDSVPARSPNELCVNDSKMKKSLSNISDDEPLYDSVASDEDYGMLPNVDKTRAAKKDMATSNIEKQPQPPGESLASSEHSDTPITLEEYMDVKRSLVTSEARVNQLVQLNTELKLQVAQLSQTVQSLLQENAAFRRLQKQQNSQHHQMTTTTPVDQRPPLSPQTYTTLPNGHSPESNIHSVKPPPARPQSMFETRDQQRPVPKHPNVSLAEENSSEYSTTNQPDQVMDRSGPRLRKSSAPALTPIPQGTDADYDTPPSHRHTSDSVSSRSDSSGHFTSASDGSMTPGTPSHPHPLDLEEDMPTQEDVVKKTERITKKIQELLISAQEGNHNSYGPCSDKIHLAVCEMAAIFPQKPKTEIVQNGLRALTYSAVRLQEECRSTPMDSRGNIDYRIKTQQVIQCAYDIAKAAKQLVMLFQ
ncbi:ARF GTPase-activating protein GIT2-like isoform X2 [Tubulanus polymorphus]|uniref:ARF GTPase-activating protein GIT2-like isoform X2 n=1 Tax=Tubulanus polymorphus TaxID=672921 RepID=UPI003DA1FB3F